MTQQALAPSVTAHIDTSMRERLIRLLPREVSDTHPDAAGVELDTEWATEMLARIAWSRLAEPGDGVAGKLLATFGAAYALELIIENPTPRKLRSEAAKRGLELGGELAQALKRWTPRLNLRETIGDIDRALAAGVSTLFPGDAHWPHALDDLGEFQPVMLWMRGDARHFHDSALSVVGARAVTGYGTHVTAEIVEGVCATGITIVSGAAYGVDAVAHRTALAVQGTTIAVLAGGVDRAYPAAHDTLLDRIAATGIVCSEMIPGSAPTRWRFLQRNRIIAALTGTTIVTEAGLRSGTLNTAGHAASLGRSLGAVPGPVTSATSAGCHRLIREYGASLVTNAREVCELMGLSDDDEFTHTQDESAREPSLHVRILDALPLRGSRSVDELVRAAGISATEVHVALAELELLGRVERRDSPKTLEAEWAHARSE